MFVITTVADLNVILPANADNLSVYLIMKKLWEWVAIWNKQLTDIFSESLKRSVWLWHSTLDVESDMPREFYDAL